ncbi:MAG: V-type ATPase subunit [Nitrospirae bacterium]|nr:V-type ATPase subunit [Nitrospirota bacterium]
MRKGGEILECGREGGYPAEYLLSRIRGRRTSLITDWAAFLSSETPLDYLSSLERAGAENSPEGVWRRLLREYRWVYRQMEEGLREIFRPFFLYTELRTLFFCLRFLSAGEMTRMEELLGHSLFSKGFRKLLLGGGDVADTVGAVGKVFVSLAPGFGQMKEIFLTKGIRTMELHVTNTYLDYVRGSRLHPVIRAFFSRLVDARNIMTLYKYLRWEMKVAPRFLSGGSIAEARLRDVFAREDLFGVIPLVRTLTGEVIETPGPTEVENSLYRGMTAFLRRAGRSTPGPGLILDYLWRCSVEARNLGIILYGQGTDREDLKGELLR